MACMGLFFTFQASTINHLDFHIEMKYRAVECGKEETKKGRTEMVHNSKKCVCMCCTVLHTSPNITKQNG